MSLTVHFVFLGCTRRPECRALFGDYVGRIQRFANVLVTELREPGDAALTRIKTQATARWVLLDAGGRQFTSQEFAHWLGKLRDRSVREVVLLCGNDTGFPDSFRERAQEAVSLSTLTMPHELARVLLAEQLYRSFCILSHHPYAK